MSIICAVIVTTILLVLFFLAVCFDDTCDEALIGISLSILFLWVILGGIVASVGDCPDYPHTFQQVKVQHVVDIPNKEFVLCLENGQVVSFKQFSDMPFHDVKFVIYETWYNTWHFPVNTFINISKTLEENKK